jgi:HK97 family phage major capsid protein
MNLQQLYRRRAEILAEMAEIDTRETAANRNYLECDEYRTRNIELEQIGSSVTVAESVDADRERRRTLGDTDTRRLNPEAGLQEERAGERRGQPAGPFSSLGDQLRSIIQSSISGNEFEPRLAQFRATGMSAGVGQEGGFLIQKDHTAAIWQRVWQTGEILKRVRRIPISSNANGINHPYIRETSRTAGNRYGGIQVYRRAEAATVTAAKLDKLAEFKLDLMSGMALVYLTEELMADAAQMEFLVNDMVAQAIAFKTEEEVFSGNGVGKPLGIMNAPCLVTVAKEAGQAAASIVPENIVNMRARLMASSRSNSIWHINQDVEPKLHLMTKTDAAGTVYGYPTYMPANGLSQSPFDTLYGRPVVPIEYASTVGTTGDITLCDWSQYVLIEKGGIDIASSIHVQFIYGENVLRFMWRNNGAPGYAWSDGALTPNKGTNTNTPFVALQTR